MNVFGDKMENTVSIGVARLHELEECEEFMDALEVLCIADLPIFEEAQNLLASKEVADKMAEKEINDDEEFYSYIKGESQ